MFKDPILLDSVYEPEKIMRLMQCSKSSDAYPVFLSVFQEFEKTIQSRIQIKAFVNVELNKENRGEDTEEKIGQVYCLLTIGPYLENYIKKLYEQGNYLEAMIYNEIGDQLVFQGTEKLFKILEQEIMGIGFLSHRYEPGTHDVSMEEMHRVYAKIQEHFDYKCGVGITDQGMLWPVKSIGYYYNIMNDKAQIYGDRDCNNCDQTECKHREFQVMVETCGDFIRLSANYGDNLLDVLRKENYIATAPCNGKGTCGKCKVKVVNGNFKYTTEEYKRLSQIEMDEHIILACCHKVYEDLTISIQKTEESYIESRYQLEKVKIREDLTGYCIGIDIGTTTMVFSLVDLQQGEEIDQLRILNPQQAYGSDVISRIEYAKENSKRRLTKIMEETIQSCIEKLLLTNDILFESVVSIVLAGNTAMTYLLLGINPIELAVAPFAVQAFTYEKHRLMLFEINIFPWIAAFVGGDILSGIYALEIENLERTSIYIDIGTNGEIALFHNGCIHCAATAAGPAFEGANITHGIGSVAGAISHVRVSSTKKKGINVKYETIQGQSPIGLCGSGIIDLVAEFLELGIIDQTGYMEKPITIHESIQLLPTDVRQVQLAKAAIAAGIDTLLATYNLSGQDIEYVYLAGGFGSGLNLENAVRIGLLSNLNIDKVIVLGNMSLAGTIKFAQNNTPWNEVKELLDKCSYLELSNSSYFNQAYIEHMMF